MAAAAGIGGLLGGIAGAQKDVVEQTNRSGVDLSKMSGRERAANQGVTADYTDLRCHVPGNRRQYRPTYATTL